LTKLLELYCPNLQIIGECEDAMVAEKEIERLKPDLIFLDVAMPGKNGIEFLKELKEIKFEVIFVTAHDKYIMQALRMAAVDYLLKPVEEQQLMNAVENAAKRIESKKINNNIETFLHNMSQKQQQQELQLCIPSLQGFQVVQINDVLYCEADNTYTIFHLKNGKKAVASRPLIDYEVLLEDANFFRIHKSSLINMKHIKEYQKGEGGTVIMSDDKALDVSRRKKDLFITRMKEVFKY